MKKFIKKLSRVAHSPQYSLLESHSPRPCKLRGFKARSAAVPDGHLPVYVGEEMQRHVISAKLLNHPVFVALLNKSAQEYGYEGVLRIPCHVIVFQRVLEGLRQGDDDSVWDIIESL